MLRPVLIMGLRSSHSHRAGPAWPRHADSATSRPLEASTCLNRPSLQPSLKMSQQPLPSRGYEFAHFALYEVIIFRHELLAGMGSEQVLHSFFTVCKTKLHPKTCSYHTVKKKQKKKNSIDAEIGLNSIYNRKTLALCGYTAVCYIGQLLLLCSVLHGVLYYDKMHFYLSCA